MDQPCLTILEALTQVLDPRGKTVADVGCGDGAIVRHLARQGAIVTGIEVDEARLQRAKEKAGNHETYSVGSGDRLPLSNTSVDAVLYIKSFHHVPRELMRPALKEAARVLKPDGLLVVIEPLAQGSYFSTMRPLEDETEVRAAAYAEMNDPPSGLVPNGELFYGTVVRFRDASHFIETVIAADPERRRRLPQVEAELRQLYESNAQRDADGTFFLAPMRRNCFRALKN